MRRIVRVVGGLLMLGATTGAAEEPLELGYAALESCRDATRRDSKKEALQAADVAEGHFDDVLESEPGSLEARVGRARVLLACRIGHAGMMQRMSLMQRIESDLGEVIEIDSRHWEARYLLATLLYNVPPFLGRRGDAIAHLEVLVEQQEAAGDPERPEPYVMLGDLLELAGEHERARRVWRRGARLYPENEPLRQRLERDGGATTPHGDAETDASAAQGVHDPAVIGLASRLEREVNRPQITGVSVGIVRGGEPLLVEGFGLADLEHDVPATPRTVYSIGSITKQFTAAAVLLLVEEGSLALDEAVADWLPPDLRPLTAGIQIRHLLSHTSGLPLNAVESADWLRDGLAEPRVGSPGERYAYSNFGYGLLGMVVEAATGWPWERFLEERLFAPLQMRATGLCDPEEIVRHRARGYAWQGDRMVHAAPIEGSPTLHYAGGLCSTVEDLLRWHEGLHGGGLLTDDGYRAMTTPLEATSGERTTYAYGLRVHAPRGRRVFQHSGGIEGFLSDAAYYPDEDLTVIVLMNSDGGDPRSLGFELAGILLGPAPPAP